MSAVNEKLGIKWSQAGQPRAYANSIYAGTVEASSREEAKEKLEQVNGAPILDHHKSDAWWKPYFTRLEDNNDGTWSFRYVREYTG